jgi:hypothetical protein
MPAQAAAETAKEQVAVAKMGIFDLERAYLAVGPTEIKVDFVRQGPQKQVYVPSDPKELVVKLYIHNTGRTGATIKRLYGEFSQQPPLGATPVYTNGQSVLTDVSVGAGVETVLHPFDFRSDVAGPQFFWGFLEYTDIFKKRHVSRFCVRLALDVNRLDQPAKYQIARSDPWRECD